MPPLIFVPPYVGGTVFIPTDEYYQAARALAPYLYYRLADTGGTAQDEIGFNDGTISGAGITKGVDGLLTGSDNDAMEFAGTGAYISTGFNTNFTDACTLMAIVVPKSANITDAGVIISKNSYYAASHTDFPIVLQYRDDSPDEYLEFRLSKGNDYVLDVLLSHAITAGNQYFVVGVYRDSGLCELYINGELQDSDTISGTISSNTREWRVGRAPFEQGGGVNNSMYEGTMDEPKIFHKALSQTDIKRLYLIGTGSEDNYATLSEAQSPLAHWRLGESSGGVAYDETGNYDGTYINTPTLGANSLIEDTDSAVEFDSSNSEYISLPSIPGITTELCIMCWVKAADTSSEYRAVALNNQEPYVSIRMNAGGTANRLQVNFRLNSSGSDYTLSTNSYTLTDTHFIAVNLAEGGDYVLYVDGNEEDSISPAGNFDQVLGPGNTIGAGRNALFNFFNGVIDEVKLFNRILSQDEIADEYAMGKHGPNTYPYVAHRLNPLAYWKLGESSGTTAADESGNGEDLTYTGSPTLGVPGLVSDSGTAVDFSGATSQYATGSAFVTALPMSVSVWVNVDSLSSRNEVFSTNYQSNYTGVNIAILTSGAVQIFYGDGTGTGSTDLKTYDTTTTGLITANNPHHIVVNCTSIDTVEIYVDGVEYATSSSNTATSVSFSGGSTDIGRTCESIHSSTAFDGTIDHLSVYPRELAPEEVVMIYDKGKDNF